VRFQHYPEILNIDFNIYKILMEMLGAYNHSFLPPRGLRSLLANSEREWESPQLDFSPMINRTVVLAARIMGRIKPFKQESPFRLRYRVSRLTSSQIEIIGEAMPGVAIWGKYFITRVSRQVVIRRQDGLLLKDTMSLRIENAKGNGLKARTTLKLIQ
jgi:hypothetical protein